MNIGPVELKSPLLLAPIAGYCDLPFRILCREIGGVGIAYTDLLNSRALLAGAEKSIKLAQTNGLDQPVGMQLYGNAEDPLPEAAIWAIDHGARVIDINLKQAFVDLAPILISTLELFAEMAKATRYLSDLFREMETRSTATLETHLADLSARRDALRKDLEGGGLATLGGLMDGAVELEIAGFQLAFGVLGPGAL